VHTRLKTVKSKGGSIENRKLARQKAPVKNLGQIPRIGNLRLAKEEKLGNKQEKTKGFKRKSAGRCHVFGLPKAFIQAERRNWKGNEHKNGMKEERKLSPLCSKRKNKSGLKSDEKNPERLGGKGGNNDLWGEGQQAGRKRKRSKLALRVWWKQEGTWDFLNHCKKVERTGSKGQKKAGRVE